MKTVKVNACIIGGGAAGFGCAHRLLKNSVSVAVVDTNPAFGGTSVFGGVNCWEPGVSLDGVHTELVRLLEKIENGCFVARTVPNGRLLDGNDVQSFEKYPWGLSVRADEGYETTLKRCRLLTDGNSENYRRFQFDDEAMIVAMNKAIEPYEENLFRFFGYSISGCNSDGGVITSVSVKNDNEEVLIEADYFVDSTGDVVLARMAGCPCVIGSEDSRSYNEPSAPDASDMNINGVSYVFRVSKTENSEHIDEIPGKYISFDAGERINAISCFNMYPNGDININMLPTMDGEKYLSLGDNADFAGYATVYHYWNHLQKNKGMKGYKLVKIFNVGLRETYRVAGKYVLCENDIRQGVLKQENSNRMIAVADHPMDMHGKGGGCSELDLPYGIPIDCAMVNEYTNLLVACRGGSFSHIAASSARLSRTMMSFGEGVGEYIKEMLSNGVFENNVQGKSFAEFKNTIFELLKVY